MTINTTRKKLLALLITLIMTLTLLPMAVLATGMPAIELLIYDSPSGGVAVVGAEVVVEYRVENKSTYIVDCSSFRVKDKAGSIVDMSDSANGTVTWPTDGKHLSLNPDELFVVSVTYKVNAADIDAGSLVRSFYITPRENGNTSNEGNEKDRTVDINLAVLPEPKPTGSPDDTESSEDSESPPVMGSPEPTGTPTPKPTGTPKPNYGGYTSYNRADNAALNIWITGSNVPYGDRLLTFSTQNSALMKLRGGNKLVGMWEINLQSGRKSVPGSTLHFRVGVENAGKLYTLCHQKANGTIESFTAVAGANGVASFYPVNELSPFMLVETNTSGVAIPKTGDSNLLSAILAAFAK